MNGSRAVIAGRRGGLPAAVGVVLGVLLFGMSGLAASEVRPEPADLPAGDCGWGWSDIGTRDPRQLVFGRHLVQAGKEVLSWDVRGGSLYDSEKKSWRAVPQTPLADRWSSNSYVFLFWTGREVLVWHDSGEGGALFDPLTGYWREIPDVGAPPPRRGATAVWTGRELMVWGGDGKTDAFFFDPAAGSWTGPSPAADVPPLESVQAVLFDDRIYFFGRDRSVPSRDEVLAAFDVPTQSWRRISRPPGYRSDLPGVEKIVRAGNELIVWGSRFDPATEQWIRVPFLQSVSGYRHLLASGNRLLVSAGWENCPIPEGCGAYFDGSWFALDPVSASSWARIDRSPEEPGPSIFGLLALDDGRIVVVDPDHGHVHILTLAEHRWLPAHRELVTGRTGFVAEWTGSELLAFGGREDDFWDDFNQGQPIALGFRYRADLDRIEPLPSIGAPSARVDAASVWTGREMIVWGGGEKRWNALQGWTFVPAEGCAAFDPTANRWRTVALDSSPPEATIGAFAAWTGGEMLVFGGWRPGSVSNRGFLLDPTFGRWHPISDDGAPSPRREAAIAWTGRELIVWGGYRPRTDSSPATALGDGAIYDVETDRWRPLPQERAPSPRGWAAAAWDHGRFFVLGGAEVMGYDDPGSRHSDGAAWEASSNSWRPLPEIPQATAGWAIRRPLATGDGESLFFFTESIGPVSGIDNRLTTGARLDLSSLTWSEDVAPMVASTSDRVFWTGSRFLGFGSTGGHALEPILSAPRPPLLAAPVDDASLLEVPIVFRWSPSPNAIEYEFLLGSEVGWESLGTVRNETRFAISDRSRLVPDRTYRWKVRAMNGCGAVESNERSFHTVPFEAAFEIDRRWPPLVAWKDVWFWDRSTGRPTSWRWDFGDGGLSFETSPHHTYQAPGRYLVALEVGSVDGTRRTEQEVEILEGIAPAPSLVHRYTVGPTDGTRTALWLWNPSDSSRPVRLRFTPEQSGEEGAIEVDRIVNPHETIAYGDVLRDLFGREVPENGRISGTPGVGMSWWRYLETEDGTTGDRPASRHWNRSFRGLAANDERRTDMDLWNDEDEEVELTLVLAAPGVRKEERLSMAPGEHRRIEKVNELFGLEQLDSFSLWFADPWSWIDASVTTTEDRTGDVVYSRPSWGGDGLLDGVASCLGGGGRSWRTRLIVEHLQIPYSSGPSTVRLDFVPRGASQPVDSRTVELAPDEVREWGDVLPELFGRTDDAGSLRVEVLTGNAGVLGDAWFESEEGRFDQLLPFFPDAYSGSRETLPGVRQDANFRTNLSILNREEREVGYRISVRAADGTLLAERAGRLPALGSVFLERAIEELGIPELVDGSIEVRAEGSWRIFAWASVVDDRTGDGRTVGGD